MIQARRKLEPVAVFLIVSALLHAVLSLGLFLGRYEDPHRENQDVEITYTDPNAKHLEVLKQIVEQKDRLNEDKDDKAKYLSKFDQKVIKETKAQNTGAFNNTVAGGAAGQPEQAKKQARKDNKKANEKGELPSLKDLSPTFAPTPQTAEQQAPRPGEEARTDDYLKDVQKGLQTILSTREFVYFSYYSRIKEQISQYWEPSVREKVKIIYRQGRTIASAHDRVTQLLIVLDRNGNLIRVEILGHSGVLDLDDAAVSAFQSAAPFPNPPKGMIEGDGTIKIRWDFILES
jgi:protein TonB